MSFKLLSLFFLIFYSSNIWAEESVFLNSAQTHIIKMVSQKLMYKPILEFKQAVIRYVKNADIRCLQGSHCNINDHNVTYKKELYFLFKNYDKFSILTLLSRTRSAHQSMVTYESDANSDEYKKYEQISSALLLICAQVICDDVRNQLLNILYEIDNRIIYWSYQKNHPITYFFRKPPIKWLKGKPQEKEVLSNINRLERKQRELYTKLGLLTEHLHIFAEGDLSYDHCYMWLEKFLRLLSCIKEKSIYGHNDIQFEYIAATLESKIKYSDILKKDFFTATISSKKPNHFTRNWIIYMTMVALTNYVMHYHAANPDVLPESFHTTVNFIFVIGHSVIVDPMTDLYQVFFGRDSRSSVEEIENRVIDIERLANSIEANVAEATQQSAQSLREYAEDLLEKRLQHMKIDNAEDIMKDVKKNNFESFNALCENTSFWYYDNRLDQEEVRILLGLDNLFKILQEYPDLIDKKILPLVKAIGLLISDSGKIIGAFVKNNFWTAKLAAFTPLAAACISVVRTYKWATTRNYSPIRIALAEVNSLLIESAEQIDDHDYGKLVYLIFKLRNKSSSLKDSLSHEFLIDVVKLESKQYSVQKKRGIIENMFNKYTFLGRVIS
ncbi:MAG TPA: hypothetical protein VLB80_01190 [Candidatus Babeliales bacterium]|nr:hypothetical protein [Candidatus Babeliales bacterium]